MTLRDPSASAEYEPVSFQRLAYAWAPWILRGAGAISVAIGLLSVAELAITRDIWGDALPRVVRCAANALFCWYGVRLATIKGVAR